MRHSAVFDELHNQVKNHVRLWGITFFLDARLLMRGSEREGAVPSVGAHSRLMFLEMGEGAPPPE